MSWRPLPWLRAHAKPAWIERYGRRADSYDVPQGEAMPRPHAEPIGRDGHQRLAAVIAPGAPIWLREIPAVELLRQIWVQNFCLTHQAQTGELGAGPFSETTPRVR
jgi:hypothetical protein